MSYEGGRTLLRFTTTTWNNGQGPLELRGGDKSTGKQVVYQRIFQDTGTYRDVQAGTFTWHEAHQHIHFDGFGNDWGSAAAQAESNQRGDWADALRTGRIGRPGADR